MLASPALRFSPWTWTTPAHVPALEVPAWVRSIRRGDAEIVLGFVRLIRGSSWFGCGPRRCEVLETEDGALLLTLTHGWFAFGRWHVQDAEQSRLGGVVGPHVLDQHGFRFATLWHEGPAMRILRTLDGTPQAWLEIAADGAAQVRFADDLPANPFLRMVIVGACVLQQRLPRA